MANQFISMNKIRQILRLYSQKKGKLRIAEQTGVSRNTVKKYVQIFLQSGLDFKEIFELCDTDLELIFTQPPEKPPAHRLQTLFGLFPYVDKELKKKGVTRQLIWEDYRKQYPDGVGRSQFNHYYVQWKGQVNPSMHMEHKAGDKMACGMGYRVAYHNVPKLFARLKMAKADGSYIREIAKLERQHLLILDDFGINPLDAQNRAAFLEIIEDRHGKGSIIVTSQIPVSKWHDIIGEKTIADAILDRIIHQAHRLELKGESLRKKSSNQLEKQ